MAALLCAGNAFADTSTKIYGDRIECNSGETVSFAVNISGNPGITAFVIGAACENDWVYFDDDVLQGNFTSTGTIQGENDVRFVNAAWYSVDEVKTDGVLFSFDVHVSPSAPDGEYPINLLVSKENTIDGELKEIEYEVVDGCINVKHVEPDVSAYSKQESGMSGQAIALISLGAVCAIAAIVWIFIFKKAKK